MKTEFLDPIELHEMDKVKLMNRTDTKYWFHIDDIEQILQEIKNDYYVLNINGESNLEYTTTYYDTDNNRMFNEHHNGKLNRYKVRRRSYVSSEISFLEVKFKSNKGRTQKKRIPAQFGNATITEAESEFLANITPFKASELHPALINNFSRVTLVNKNFNERCTIDMNLQFKSGDKVIALDKLVIVEIKSDGKTENSPLALALREQRIKTSGFSKYCIGRTITDSTLNPFCSKNSSKPLNTYIFGL
ncbi:MAG: polyphosphate polymerase domain-containing protein [Paludibacter sp.]|nr:polyphosphate polymerase domain-containing protein [Paludibacter sp.]